MKDIRCIDCQKTPGEIEEYIDAGLDNGMTPQAFVEQEEGTYNPENGHFLCTDDFLAREFDQGVRLVGVNGRPWIAP